MGSALGHLLFAGEMPEDFTVMADHGLKGVLGAFKRVEQRNYRVADCFNVVDISLRAADVALDEVRCVAGDGGQFAAVQDQTDSARDKTKTWLRQEGKTMTLRETFLLLCVFRDDGR